jgi:predicted nuclease with RNAse H fold
MLYLGIDPTAGRRPLNYAALDGKLDIVAEGEGKLEDVLALLEKYSDVVCGVDAPLMPNQGLMAQAEVRQRFGLPVNGKSWTQYRVCEYELRRRNIKLYNTPAEIDSAPAWMAAGWKLYESLRTVGFETFAPGSAAPHQFFEVHPHATFTVLLGHIPYRKDHLEGRWQRQLLLCDEGVRLPDPLDILEEVTRHHLLSGTLEWRGLRTHDGLDALASALTAFYAHARPDRITFVGESADGQIVVPTNALKDTYENPRPEIPNPKS